LSTSISSPAIMAAASIPTPPDPHQLQGSYSRFMPGSKVSFCRCHSRCCWCPTLCPLSSLSPAATGSSEHTDNSPPQMPAFLFFSLWPSENLLVCVVGIIYKYTGLLPHGPWRVQSRTGPHCPLLEPLMNPCHRDLSFTAPRPFPYCAP
jgi:hypothetical protein